jgi:hypothetical protein
MRGIPPKPPLRVKKRKLRWERLGKCEKKGPGDGGYKGIPLGLFDELLTKGSEG